MAASETDNTEQPVTQQLRQASLTNKEEGKVRNVDIEHKMGDSSIEEQPPTNEEDKMGDSSIDEQPTTDAQSLRTKRSFDEIDEDSIVEQTGAPTGAATVHTRKRSRDNTAEVDEQEGSRKRTSDELKRVVSNKEAGSRPATSHAQVNEDTKDLAAGDIASPKMKRSRLEGLASAEESSSTTKLAPGSGFANTAAISPFGAVPASTTSQPQTSTSAFAASKFSTLSGVASPFGNVGKTSGGFGSLGAVASADVPSDSGSSDKNEATTKSAFGGALGAKSAFSTSNGKQNGFGSGFGKSTGAANGFGNGSAFGSLNQGPGLSSFASGKATPTSKPSKSFGAPTDENDEPDDDGEELDESGFKSPVSVGIDEEKKDGRFYEQEVETGEEDEEVVFSSRAKLYSWALNESGKKEWKERGTGMLKLNKKQDSSDDGLINLSAAEPDKAANGAVASTSTQPQARFLMRAEGSHRVVLNTPVKKEIKVASSSGGAPANGYLMLMGAINGDSKLELLQIKLAPKSALELYSKVLDLQKEM